jgi:hypothetical protein
MFVGEAESLPVCMASTQKTRIGGNNNLNYFETFGRKFLKWRKDICLKIGHNDIKLLVLQKFAI